MIKERWFYSSKGGCKNIITRSGLMHWKNGNALSKFKEFINYCKLWRIWKEKADSAVDYSLLCGFFSQGFPLPLGAWDRLRQLIMALTSPLPYNDLKRFDALEKWKCTFKIQRIWKEKRSITRYYVVSFRRGFLFLLLPGIGCVI